MSQDFHPLWNSTEAVNLTMAALINGSLDALRTAFSHADPPTGTVGFQWWADLYSGILKLRNEANSDWIDVYDFDNEAILLNAEQVLATHISNEARKPTLIENEDIGPGSCALRTKFTGGSMPWIPQEIFAGIGGLGDITVVNPTWNVLLTSRLYVPDDVGILRVRALQTTCSISFVLDGVRSTPSSVVDPGPAWGSDTFLDATALNGVYDFTIEGLSTKTGPPVPYGGISAVEANWDV